MFSQLWENDVRPRQDKKFVILMENKFQKLIQQEKGEFGTLKELFSSHFGLKCHQHILGNVVGNQY